MDKPKPIPSTVREKPEDREQLTTTTAPELTSMPVQDTPEARQQPLTGTTTSDSQSGASQPVQKPPEQPTSSTGPTQWQTILATARPPERSLPPFTDPFRNSPLCCTQQLPGLHPRDPDSSLDFPIVRSALGLYNYLISPHRDIQPAPACGVAGVYPFQFPANMRPQEHGWTDLGGVAKQCVEERRRVNEVRRAAGAKRVVEKRYYDVEMVVREIKTKG